MLKDYFYFRKSDRRAILALAAVAIVSIAAYALLRTSEPKTAQPPHQQTTPAPPSDAPGSPVETAGEVAAGAPLHVFDPNTVDSATLVGFGISPRLVRTFLRYRAAGKVFRTADDLLDTYGWSEADIAPLRPYIQIGASFRQQPRYAGGRKDYGNGLQRYDDHPRSAQAAAYRQRDSIIRLQREARNSYPDRNKFRELTLVDANTADTTLLMRIPGIGSHFASSVVRLRQRLGGFVSVEQLLDISNFPEETLEWFFVTPGTQRRINLATTDMSEQGRHPYIGFRRASALSAYQRLYGPIRSAEQLRQTRIFSAEELERLLPYLEFSTQ